MKNFIVSLVCVVVLGLIGIGIWQGIDKGLIGKEKPPAVTNPVAIKGDTGEQGAKGDKGDTGERGADGKDGTNGKDGINGIDGQNGLDGRDGGASVIDCFATAGLKKLENGLNLNELDLLYEMPAMPGDEPKQYNYQATEYFAVNGDGSIWSTMLKDLDIGMDVLYIEYSIFSFSGMFYARYSGFTTRTFFMEVYNVCNIGLLFEPSVTGGQYSTDFSVYEQEDGSLYGRISANWQMTATKDLPLYCAITNLKIIKGGTIA